MQISTLNFRALRLVVLGACLLILTNPLRSQVLSEHPFVHPLFSEHAVLQRGKTVPVWGWAAPGTRVTVNFAGQERSSTAGKDGKWCVRLKQMSASANPQTMTVSAKGYPTVTISDLLVGDVWLCSGQSNMEMGMSACGATADIAAANFPRIRLLTVPHRIEKAPVETAAVEWTPCSPEALKKGGFGGFSAAAFYFGRQLHLELGVPIGLIHSSWGGTVAEAWTSIEALEKMETMKDRLATFAEMRKPAATREDFGATYEKWAKANDSGTAAGWDRAAFDASSWKIATMPQHFEKAGLPDYDGFVWFRREFDLPADWAGKPAVLSLGAIDDADTTWLNGQKVGQMNRYDQPRIYKLGRDVLRAGRNVLTVRVLDTGGDGGFSGTADQLNLRLANGAETAPISLAGEWRMKDSTPMSRLPSPPQPPDLANPNVTTVLYNGMIAPLLPFAIRGAIWYQGESNADRAYQYRELLPVMIHDWRKRFGVGDFPFYIVQLASFTARQPQPRENEWAELREAQALTAQKVRNCGLAVAIDIGEANDIHPKNKHDVGARLALNALAGTYGRNMEYSGPWYKSMKATDGSIRLRFTHAGTGLSAKGGQLKGFAIAGADKKFVWADARIEGAEVVVSSAQVPKPVAVRYGWDSNPDCNLYNGAGLPAVPFRTDDWPGLTQSRR